MRPSFLSIAREACLQQPPMWGLKSFVAVHPWQGWAGMPLVDAARKLRASTDAKVLPEFTWLQQQCQAKGVTTAQVQQAAARVGLDADRAALLLTGPCDRQQVALQMTLAAALHMDDKFCRDAAMWCGRVYQGLVDRDGQGLYAVWRQAQESDHSWEIGGLEGWREYFQKAPKTAQEVLESVPEFLEFAQWDPLTWAQRLLHGVRGWAGWLRSQEFLESGTKGIQELLAIRVSQELALWTLARPEIPTSHLVWEEDLLQRLCLQEALEDAWVLGVRQKLANRNVNQAPAQRLAVFCIDVRSEVMRRHLEFVDPEMRTSGFAGFFGVSLQFTQDQSESAHCPVLLPAKLKVHPVTKPKRFVNNPMHGSTATLPGVELFGWKTAWSLLQASLFPKRHEGVPVLEREGELTLLDDLDAILGDDALVPMAQAIVRNLGISQWPRLVALVGHSGRSANNPHEAGLHCGACGGRGGALNARVAAQILQNPEVRQKLSALGVELPLDTVFVAAEHDTTLDHIAILDTGMVPESHQRDLVQLEASFAKAGVLARQERAEELGLDAQASAQTLWKQLVHRSSDPAEVRPEWALAGNAGFLVAPREQSVGANLGGRVFLHEHDAQRDTSAGVLELILTAPMVVATWINLQYFASTVDAHLLGAGAKNLHNRVGELGVLLGDGADLQVGLSWPSVAREDGSWKHEPLRLQAMIQDSRERMDAILAKHRGVTDLVTHGWLRLFAIEGEDFWLRTASGWEKQAPLAA